MRPSIWELSWVRCRRCRWYAVPICSRGALFGLALHDELYHEETE